MTAIHSVFRSLRVRNYRLYAAGQLVSVTGTWMQRVAQDWLVLELTDSGAALGVVTALQFGPALVLGLWGGVLADRGNKRTLLLATQGAIALCALVLGLLVVTDVVAYWQVAALALALGLIAAVDTPVRNAFAAEMVGPDALPNAVALNSAIFNLGRILGPAAAGVTIAAVGTGWAFIANAVSSVGVLGGLLAMRTAELQPVPAVRRAKGQLVEGLRYVRRRPDLMLTMVLIFVVGTFGFNFQITTALMAKQVFHQDASGYGLLTTVMALGSFGGALLATMRRRRASGFFLLMGACVFSLIEIGAGLMPSYVAFAVALVPAGLAMLTFTTAANSSVQLGVEPTMRGRVLSLYFLCFMGGTPLGAPLIGWVAGAAGPRWSIVGGGLICLLAALALGLIGIRRRGLSAGEVAARFRTRPVVLDWQERAAA